MTESYNISPKKSILCGLAAVFLFLAPAAAREPSDPGYALQAAMWRQVNAPAAWNSATGSADVVVAVIDTGLDTNNPDIKNRIWINEKEISDNGIDDDNNGYVDDINGWNFIENNNIVTHSAVGNESDHDLISHGTAIAGLIGAEANNGTYGTGLNWQIKIMPVRAINDYGSGSYEDIINAINYAANNAANVISISFIGEATDVALENAIHRAYEKGIITVVAAGNNNNQHDNLGDLGDNPLYPICFDDPSKENWILGVTAVDSKDRLAKFANYGSCVDLSAPGENIYSLDYYDAAHTWSSGFSGGHSGTSFAVPFVAGSVALLKSVRPDWSNQEIIRSLMSSADDIDFYNPGYAGLIGYGRLNIGKAILTAVQNKARAGFNNFYYGSGQKIYRYELVTGKNIYLQEIEGRLIYPDKQGPYSQNKFGTAVLAEDGGAYSVIIFDLKGNTAKTIILPGGIVFKFVRVASSDGDARVIAAGEDGKTRQSRFFVYDGAGNLLKNFYGGANLVSLAAKENSIIVAHKNRNMILFSAYDFDGNKHSGNFSVPGTGVDDIAAGALLVKGGKQAVALVKDNKTVQRYIFDFDSTSFFRDAVAGSCSRWSAAVSDTDFDKLDEVLVYCPAGGKFPIIRAKGSQVTDVLLPKLE